MFSLLTAGIAPAIALLSYFYLKDEFEQEPIIIVLKSYLVGALLVFPILFIQFALQEEGMMATVASEVLQTAFIEEFLKWFIIMITVYNHVEFNERYDGIVYSTAVALGFASAENVLYLISYGLETAFFRALFPVSSHALFGVVMGYYLGKAKFNEEKKIKYFIYSFAFPFLLHTVYNGILIVQNQWILYLIPFMIFLWVYSLRKVKKANQFKRDEWKKQFVS